MRTHLIVAAILAVPLTAQNEQTTAATAAMIDDDKKIDTSVTETGEKNTVIHLPGMKSLTISGQYRLRYENHIDFDFDNDSGSNDDFFIQRLRLDIAPQFNDTISALFQLQDARAWGTESDTLDGSADAFDLHQGFIEIEEFPVLTGTGKAGRQIIELGDQRLVSSLEWSNTGRSFDGYRHTWSWDDFALEALFTQTGLLIPGQPTPNEDAFLGGLYATGNPWGEANGDLYALVLSEDQTLSGGTQHRGTLGTRLVQPLGDLELGGEFATQFGEIDNADIPIGKTSALHTHATYSSSEWSLEPWVRAEFNWASGNDPATADNERFNPLFPFAHRYHGYMDFALWSNLQHFSLELGTKPADNSKLVVFWHFFRADQAGDSFGGPSGQLSPGIVGQSNTMGNEFDATFTANLDTSPLVTIVEVGYGIFLPGPGTQQAKGSDDPAHFLYAQADFRF